MNEKLPIRNVIAGNVKKYRKQRLLTQEALAELADISNTYIANIECGQTWISDKTLEKIANALHIDEYLLFIPETDDKSTDKSASIRQQTIEYMNKRQNELNSYVKNFLSETFDYILNNQ